MSSKGMRKEEEEHTPRKCLEGRGILYGISVPSKSEFSNRPSIHSY